MMAQCLNMLHCMKFETTIKLYRGRPLQELSFSEWQGRISKHKISGILPLGNLIRMQHCWSSYSMHLKNNTVHASKTIFTTVPWLCHKHSSEMHTLNSGRPHATLLFGELYVHMYKAFHVLERSLPLVTFEDAICYARDTLWLFEEAFWLVVKLCYQS